MIEALRQIRYRRCVARRAFDEYHWQDGIGPGGAAADDQHHWGGVVENNHFGTHEFMLLCELTGAEPYICGNAGSGTVHDAAGSSTYLRRQFTHGGLRWPMPQ